MSTDKYAKLTKRGLKIPGISGYFGKSREASRRAEPRPKPTRLEMAESKLAEFDVYWDGEHYSFDPRNP